MLLPQSHSFGSCSTSHPPGPLDPFLISFFFPIYIGIYNNISQYYSSQMQNLTFLLGELHVTSVSPLFQHVEVPLAGNTTLCLINHSSNQMSSSNLLKEFENSYVLSVVCQFHILMSFFFFPKKLFFTSENNLFGF